MRISVAIFFKKVNYKYINMYNHLEKKSTQRKNDEILKKNPETTNHHLMFKNTKYYPQKRNSKQWKEEKGKKKPKNPQQ